MTVLFVTFQLLLHTLFFVQEKIFFVWERWDTSLNFKLQYSKLEMILNILVSLKYGTSFPSFFKCFWHNVCHKYHFQMKHHNFSLLNFSCLRSINFEGFRVPRFCSLWQVCKSTASPKMSSRVGKLYLTLIYPTLCYILTSLHKPSKTNPSHKKQQSVTPCITSSWSRSQLKHSKEPCRNTHAVQVLPCTTKRLSAEMMQQLHYWACLIW